MKTAEINDSDISNYATLREGLGQGANLPDQIINLYEVNHRALVPFARTAQQRIALTLISGQCMKHLVVGANNLLRGYAGVMFRETRGAVEAAGLARNLYRRRDVYQSFIADSEHDNVARTEYRKHTRHKALFPDDAEPIIKTLGRHYDYASMKAHTNVMNFVSQLINSESDLTSKFMLQDFAPNWLGHEFPVRLLWMCVAHLDIITASRSAVFKSIPADYAEFDELLREIVDRTEEIKKRYDQYFAANPMP